MRKWNGRLVVICLFIFIAFLGAGCSKASLQPAKTESSSGAALDVYFPRVGQDPAPVLAGLYNGAKSNIDVAIYGLTHPQIVNAIIDAHKRGVQVRVITDSEESKGDIQKHAVNSLLLAGIPVKVNTHSGLMHLKMSLVDSQVLTSGSYNYTKSASDRNDEMFLVIKDPHLVKTGHDEFERMWSDEKNFAAVK